ncbi:MAG: energy transducer TonB [Campylobacterota bacterium]|nr:energy transducer TonB [Campylobacterota bacterium]
MNRYTLSLIITTVIYILLGLSIWFLLSLEIPKDKPHEKIIKIKIIKPKKVETKEIKKPEVKPALEPKPKIVPKVKPKPVLKPKAKVIPKPKPKVVPKPKAKVIPKPKPKVVPKPKPVLKPKTETKEVVKQVVKEKVYEKIIEEDFTDIDIAFTKKVRENIIKNKKYPRSAIRRNIQGIVKVIFDIKRDGSISNIRIDTDSKILEKATRKSLNKSFPIKVPSEILNNFPKRNIHVNIEFRLHG